MASDVDAAVQAAIGGIAPRRFWRATGASTSSFATAPRYGHAGGNPKTSCCPRPMETTFRSARWRTFHFTKALS